MILNEEIPRGAHRGSTDMSEALVAERTSTGLSDALESLGSKTSGTGRMSLGRSTINPYETLAANAPGVQRYTTGDERLSLTRAEASTIDDYTLMPPAGGGSTFVQSLFNAINMLLGIGVLAYPNALKRTGWIGLIILCLITLATRHTAGLLKKSIELHPECRSFSDLGRKSYGTLGTTLITIAFFFELLVGACTAYLILFADHLNSMYPLSVSDFIFIGTAAVVPTTWLKDLSGIAYVSYVGVFSTFVLVAVIIYSGFDQSNEHNFWDIGTTQTANGDALQILYATGVFAVGFSGHPVFTSVYTSMKDKKRFPEMLNYTYAITIFFYAGMSAIGYVLYGTLTDPEVTMNLPAGVVTKLCKWMIVINSYCKFTLTLQPIAEVLEDVLDSSPVLWVPRQEFVEDEYLDEIPKLHQEGKSDITKEELNGSPASKLSKNYRPSVTNDTERLSDKVFGTLSVPSEAEDSGLPAWMVWVNLSVERARYLRRIAIRTVLVLAIMTVAQLVPNFDKIMAFSGSLLSITVSIVFPPLAYVKLAKISNASLSTLSEIGNLALGMLAFIVALSGTVAAVLL